MTRGQFEVYMHKLKPLFYFLFVLCSALSTMAQQTIIDHYSKDYGQFYRWVYDITQDDHGFLWFGTHTGLRRYDGTDFLVYQHSDTDSTSLSVNTILRVAKGDSNTIWAYGDDGIFNKLDLIQGTFTRVNSFFKNDTLVTSPISTMKHFKSLSNGDFIVMFQHNDTITNLKNCSFWKYNVNKEGFDHLMDVPTKEAEINYFSERSDGRLWLWGLGNGYYLVDFENNNRTYYPVPTSRWNSTIPIDENRNFWYPSNYHEKEIEALKSFKVPEEIDVQNVERIRPDNKGNIWFYYGDEALYHFDGKTLKLEKFKHPMFQKSKGEQIMYSIFVDQDGGYWNGHFFGAVRFKNEPELFQKYFNRSIDEAEKNQSLFVGRDIIELSPSRILVKDNDQQLYLVDLVTQKTKKIVPKVGPSSTKVFNKGFHAMVLRKDGHLWLNQSDKLIRLNIETSAVESFEVALHKSSVITDEDPFNKYVPKIFEDASGNLWWCDPKGLFIFDDRSKTLVPVSVTPAPNSVNANFKFASYDPQEDAIYGTFSDSEHKGIYRVNCKSKSVTLLNVFSKREGYDILITAILKWKNELWLSTNKGLVRYHPETHSRNRYTIENGLPSNIVFSAMGGEKYLWLGTKKGLCQFDPFQMQIANYYKEQGLPFNEFNIGSYKRMSTGTMFFGGENGVVGFDPKDFALSKTQKGQFNLAYVTKYNESSDTATHILNLPYNPIDEIVIYPEERTVVFKYMLALYDQINENQYFHLLEGLDKNWINNGSHNEARYLQIPPGTYTFRAKAKGPYKIDALNELAIPVVVKQYWYLRWWAIASYILLGTLVISLFYRMQLYRKLDRQEAYRMRELDDLKTRMYTNITHEFRTPLTVILGMNEALKDYATQGEKEKVQHANKMIDRNGKNLLNLVNQMLELSKLNSGKMEVHNEQGNIVAYLKYLLESFRSYSEEKGVHIHFRPQEEEIMMDYDMDKMYYIVSNLLSNAIKFTMENGEIYLDVSEQVDAHGSPQLVLKVRDTGIGIEESKIAHVFDRFYQADDSHTRIGEGTGIGLSLVNELVKLLKGTIQVKSKVNEGSEFTVTLPITRVAQLNATHNRKEKSLLFEGSKRQSISDETGLSKDQNVPLVLIVEDNVDVSQYIESRIKSTYRIVTAEDGKEGMEKATTLIPDVIISDVMMPRMDGFELCRNLKKDERTSHIPIVLLTGKADIDSKIEGLEHGADAYLEKPFNSKELLIRLKNLLHLRAEIQKRYSESDLTQPIQGLSATDNQFLSKVRSVILEHISEDEFDVKNLCELVHLSRAQLHRKLIALTGESTSQLVRKVQLEKAKELLAQGEFNVSEVAFQVGFKTQAHFSRVFSETFGIPPSSYRK